MSMKNQTMHLTSMQRHSARLYFGMEGPWYAAWRISLTRLIMALSTSPARGSADDEERRDVPPVRSVQRVVRWHRSRLQLVGAVHSANTFEEQLWAVGI